MTKFAIFLAAVALLPVPACGKKKKELGDKKAACDNIYSTYLSHQDKKVWADACNAAPDETVRCVNLIMDEGKDSDCAKAANSPERTKLVVVLNGKPEAAPPPPPPPEEKKKEAPPAQTTPPALQVTELPAAKCPPGTKYKDPPFCIALPKNAKIGKPDRYEQGGQVSIENGPMIRWYLPERYDILLADADRTVTAVGANQGVGRVDLANGRGRVIVYVNNGVTNVTSVIKGTKWITTCDGSDSDPKSEKVTACQTLTVD